MKIRSFTQFFILLGIGIEAFAAAADDGITRHFHTHESQISFSLPKDWQDVHDFFGSELMLLGPQNLQGRRLAITVTDLNLSDWKLDTESLQKNQMQFRQGRQEWLTAVRGKLIDFLPYRIEKRDRKEVHKLGVIYELGETEYVEQSYYILCNARLYHLKSLATKTHESTSGETLSKIIESFQCD